MTEVRPPPDALVEHLRSSSRDGAVYEHAISVRTGWWNAQKVLPGGPVRATGDNEVQKICRADLFRLAEGAVNDKSGTSAQSLLWHTLAWGTGLKHRNNKRRIKSVLERPDGALLLRDAALASREDPAAAFSMLRPGRRNAFAWLGPNFHEGPVLCRGWQPGSPESHRRPIRTRCLRPGNGEGRSLPIHLPIQRRGLPRGTEPTKGMGDGGQHQRG